MSVPMKLFGGDNGSVREGEVGGSTVVAVQSRS
jgi:hypothetical protein